MLLLVRRSTRSLGGQALSSAPLLALVALARFCLPHDPCKSLHARVATMQPQASWLHLVAQGIACAWAM